MTDVTAVVVTHNSAIHIGACLTALGRAGVAVRVIDNASTDATAAFVGREHPDVALTAHPANIGFAGAVNLALAGVGTGIVLLVNPDCLVPAATVAGLVDLLRARPEIGIAGPRLVDEHDRIAVSAHPFESLASVVLSRFGGAILPVRLRRVLSGRRRRQSYDACLRPDGPAVVDWLSGACLAVRTDLLRDIGGLDERYFLYYEDEELCLQAWRRGSQVVYLPEVSAVHIGGASSHEVGATWPHLYRSMLVFFARHRRSSYQAVRIAVLVRALLGIGLAGLRLALRREAGPARARAWRRVARIALTGTHRAMAPAPSVMAEEPA